MHLLAFICRVMRSMAGQASQINLIGVEHPCYGMRYQMVVDCWVDLLRLVASDQFQKRGEHMEL